MIRPRSLIAFGLVAAAALGLAGASYSIAQSNSAPADPAVASTTIPRLLIGAVGTVEPRGGAIAVAPPVAGLIAAVLVTPGDTVAAGQVLVQLDGRLAEARIGALESSIASAEAALAEVEGTLPTLRAQLAIAEAAVMAAEVQRAEAEADLAASEQLVSGQTIARREIERKVTALRAAEAVLAEATARLAQAQAEVDRTDPDRDGTRLLPLLAAIENARAALATAETERDLLTVRSPVAGRVLEVNARPGEYAGQSDGDGLVTLAADGNLQVRVEVEEADVPLLVDGAAASALVRGGDGAQSIPLAFVRREPLLKPKATLSGGPAERIDTRVVEVLFDLDATAGGVVPGQLLDVLIETGNL